jgi:hypothetical protein
MPAVPGIPQTVKQEDECYMNERQPLQALNKLCRRKTLNI